MNLTDPIALTEALIKIPSVTPDQGQGLNLIEIWLKTLGFECSHYPFGQGHDLVDNLYARRSLARLDNANPSLPCLCFAGHSDVVPTGDIATWTAPPFSPSKRQDRLYGRGVADMKGAIACFISAIARLDQAGTKPNGDIAFLITGDEEGPSINGMQPMLKALAKKGEQWSACITGEPTNPNFLGEAMKIGRRGSLQAVLTAYGKQGHTGYPALADNAAHRLIILCQALLNLELDQGSPFFEPSTLAISTLDIGNSAGNIIPAKAKAAFNIRFNELHSGASLSEVLNQTLAKADPSMKYELEIKISGESFLTQEGKLSQSLSQACLEVVGHAPELSTKGGTSDSRFIKDYCQVVDFGLVGRSMHMVDEEVEIKDLENLTKIYQATILNFFK